MNKKELIILLTEKTELKRSDVKKVVEAFIDVIVDRIAADERISMKGFGVFHPVYQDSRPVRNPRTGEELKFIPRNNFRFKPGDDVIRKLNKA